MVLVLVLGLVLVLVLVLGLRVWRERQGLVYPWPHLQLGAW